MTVPHIDTHIHATAYRGEKPDPEATVSAVLARCGDQGLDFAGVVEHFWHSVQCLRQLSAEFAICGPSVPSAIGTELNMVDPSGQVDGVSEECIAAGIQFTLAGMHWVPPSITTAAECIAYSHKTMIAVVRCNPWVDVVVHPWRLARGVAQKFDEGGWRFGLVPEALLVELAEVLREHGTACEIHVGDIVDLEDPDYHRFIDILMERGVLLTVGSDTHGLDGIGRTAPIYDFLDAYGVMADQIWIPAS